MSTTRIAHTQHPSIAPRGLTVFTLLILAIISAVTPVTAHAISRNTVLARAQTWVDAPQTYSQTKKRGGYRKDCSGYVSMCWKTGTSYNTRSFGKVTKSISAKSLKPGDAMLKKGTHIRLFYGWLDSAHDEYVAYEAANEQSSQCLIESVSSDLASGYKAVRYKHITDSNPSTNLLVNPTFDVWGYTGDSYGEQPLWWYVHADENTDQADIVTRVFAPYVHTKASALFLTNASSDPSAVSAVSQTARVSAGKKYSVKLWAAMPSNPSGLSVRITYSNKSGGTLASYYVNGASGRPFTAAYTAKSFTTTAPAGAISATVELDLAGGTSPDDEGNIVAGTKALVDDVSLTRVK